MASLCWFAVKQLLAQPLIPAAGPWCQFSNKQTNMSFPPPPSNCSCSFRAGCMNVTWILVTCKIILRHALRRLTRHFVWVLRMKWGKTSTYDPHSVRKAHTKWRPRWRSAWIKFKRRSFNRSLVLHAAEVMTYIVSGGALNYTHSLR